MRILAWSLIISSRPLIIASTPPLFTHLFVSAFPRPPPQSRLSAAHKAAARITNSASAREKADAVAEIERAIHAESLAKRVAANADESVEAAEKHAHDAAAAAAESTHDHGTMLLQQSQQQQSHSPSVPVPTTSAAIRTLRAEINEQLMRARRRVRNAVEPMQQFAAEQALNDAYRAQAEAERVIALRFVMQRISNVQTRLTNCLSGRVPAIRPFSIDTFRSLLAHRPHICHALLV
jgi:hypothetical protein